MKENKEKPIIIYPSELYGLNRQEMGELLWAMVDYHFGDEPKFVFDEESKAAIAFGSIKKRIEMEGEND